MTANQIAYQQLKETQRSNVVREGETERSNRTRESETSRSNLVNEGLKLDIQNAQKERMSVQNVTDVIGATGNLIGNAGKAAGAFASLIPLI